MTAQRKADLSPFSLSQRIPSVLFPSCGEQALRWSLEDRRFRDGLQWAGGEGRQEQEEREVKSGVEVTASADTLWSSGAETAKCWPFLFPP